MSAKVEEFEQYQRSNKLEMKGVSDAGGVYDVVKRVRTLLDESILISDIDVCHCVPHLSRQKEHNCPLLAPQERDKIFQKSKKTRFTPEDLDYSGKANPAYVNEHLTS